MSLNILFVDPNPFPTGGAMTKRHRYLVDYLNSQNITSSVLVCDFKNRNAAENPQEGSYGLCRYKNITPIAASKHFIKFWREGTLHIKEFYKPGEENVAIFDTMLVWSSYPFYIYAQKLGYTIVFDQVETSMLANGKVSLLRWINIKFGESLTNKAFTKWPGIVISTALEEENKRLYPNRKLCLLQNATPILCEDNKTSLHKPLTLLYSGTYSPKDGVQHLLQGVIKAHEEGVDCKLILLGSGTKDHMKVLDNANGHDFIEYLGYVSDEKLIELLSTCDVLCMTRINSRFARFGFPFKLSEYLATGNVVLATDVGDVTKYVENRVSAYVIEPNSADAICRTIMHISTHEEEAVSVARRGKECAKQHFSIDVVGNKFVKFLEEISKP